MKRVFDIVFSLIGLMVFSIPIGIVCFLIKTREHHPILFRQERIGKDMKPFMMLKIQTMVNGEVTRTGKKIRETGIDEILQFFNVLKGDMSIVGPRALLMKDIKGMKWDDEYHAKRWTVRPGITGFAQMYEKHLSKASFLLDCRYIEKYNFFLDFVLLCITFAINIFGKKRVLKLLFNRDFAE